MQIYFFWAGAIMSFVTFYVHTFIGGPIVAAPLLADRQLPKASKWLNYYCWHNTTVLLLFIGFAFIYVALNPEKPELVLFASLLSASLSIVSVAVALKGKIHPLRFPSTSLFAAIAILGLFGLIVN